MRINTKFIYRFIILCFLGINITGPLIVLFSGEINLDKKWHEADRSSSLIAPDPEIFTEAIVQIYSARAYNWRGIFAVHTWLASKEENARQYTVHHVVGWNERRGLPVVVNKQDIPDRSWYGRTPFLIKDIRGDSATGIISRLDRVVKEYPYKNNYTVWPGPNSNTFIAHLGREIPELSLSLPAIAIGKDFLPEGSLIGTPPSGKGLQLSVLGLLGIIISPIEGVEFNFLGLVTGIHISPLSVKIPGIGQIGSGL